MALFRMLSLSVSTDTYTPMASLILSLLRSTFASTVHWTCYDAFFRQKDEAFKTSKSAVLELAEHFRVYAAREQVDDASQNKLVFVPLTLPSM
jgi:hypothetical protein